MDLDRGRIRRIRKGKVIDCQLVEKILKEEKEKEKKDSARIILMKMMERMMVITMTTMMMMRMIVRMKRKMIMLRENQEIAVSNMNQNLRPNCKAKMEKLNQFKK